MARYSSGNTQPLTYWNSLPVYLTTILTALFVAGLVVSAVLMSMGSPLLRGLIFAMPLEPPWSLWRLLTYVFVGQVSFFTPFSILFFYWLSVGIETHLSRRVLVRLLLLIALITPAAAALWWWILHVPSDTFVNGEYMLFSGLLVAFATLYPTTEAWGWIPFKWIAFACVVCGSLMLLAGREWVALSQLWASCAVGHAYIRHAGEREYDDYRSPISRLKLWFQRRKFRVVKAASPGSARRPSGDSGPGEEMDRLLDKIVRSGISSLTPAERARLEKARQALLKKEGS